MMRRHFGLVLPVLAALTGLSTPVAAEQSELPVPRVQVGAEMSFGSVGGGSQSSPREFVPRISVNFSPRWAFDLTADRYRRSGAPGTLDERIVLFQVRAAIAESRNGLRLSGLLGGGIDFTRYDFPAYEGISYDPSTYGQSRMYPEESLSHRRPLVLAGLGLSRPISPHVSVHSEVKFFPFERYGFGVRATVGVTAAVGRFPPASKTTWLSVAPDRPIRIGQRMWVTLADGTQITGGMLSTTPSSLTIAREGGRETIPVASLARVDVLESPTVARTRWMVIGGLSGLGLGAAMTASWVASNGGEGADAFGIWGPGLATLGIVVGGLVGGELDRRRSVRRTVFDISRPSSTFTVTPIVALRARGLAATIRW